MDRKWGGLGLLAVALLTVAGCANEAQVKRPPQPMEEFTVPPENDPRYDRPPEFPKEVLERDVLLQKAKNKDKDGPPGMMGGPRSPGNRFNGM